MDKRERLRQRYRPAVARLLFIGESPPASGRFFYQQDSGLYRAIRDAFCAVDPAITDESFLAVFQTMGCYLVDTCADPVDHLGRQPRRAACRASESSLSRKILQLQPEAIVTLLRSIRPHVQRAVADAKWEGPIIEVPYPGRWARHRAACLQALAPHLEKLLGATNSSCPSVVPRDRPPNRALGRWSS